jgi:predicted acyl esterase
MLDAGGKLNKSEEPAAETEPVSYAHDPADPVPSIGGSNLFLPCGPLDQAPNKDREDMLWFETEPLEENFVITGPMMANLKVGSDAVDTDFMVKIMDKCVRQSPRRSFACCSFSTDPPPPPVRRYETGEYKLLQEGAVRMRNNIFEDMEADRTYEMQLDMWNTSYVFSPGHSIAVSVASSNYPRFSNNFNNGKTLIDETLEEDAEVATNTIMPGSYVELPVVSLRDLPRTRVIEEINELYEEHAMMGVMLAESLAKK